MYGDVPGGSVVKNLSASSGDACSIPGSVRPPAEGNGTGNTPVFLLGKSQGAWWATVHGVTKESDMT